MNDLERYYSYLNYYNNLNYIPYKQERSISSQEGFKKGNLFPETYKEYKNYKPQEIKVQNEKEKLILQIDIQRFTLIDLALYLDIYPNDINLLREYNKALYKEKELINKYKKNYGPLTQTNEVTTNNWLWIKSPWPWEVQY